MGNKAEKIDKLLDDLIDLNTNLVEQLKGQHINYITPDMVREIRENTQAIYQIVFNR
ncbi:MAG: hypothetical protein H6Q73_205 [Firmicutes bacterium]|nr:hypothetical protein [Bacillota bacterium]